MNKFMRLMSSVIQGRGTLKNAQYTPFVHKLLGVEFAAGVQVIEVQYRVQYQRIAASGFAAIDRIVREQNHVA